MKKILTKSIALAICMVIVFATPAAVYADAAYTYTYDFWEEVQECPNAYSVSRVLTAAELGLSSNFKNPSGLYEHDGHIFVCDSGNNRIVELVPKSVDDIEVIREIKSFNGCGKTEVETFANPTDIAIAPDGDIFIADQGNARVLKLDKDLNYVLEFNKPDDSALNADLVFAPKKLVIDASERVYCNAAGINKGLVKYENDGTFSGFVGATPVKYNLWDYFWKKFATQEQRAQMQSFVPTEYENICIDHDGFIYATIASADSQDIDDGVVDVVRKLNFLGGDTLIRNGYTLVIGDIYMGAAGGYNGASQFADICVFDNDIYVCLDKNRGRLFAYDDQGRLMYAFGGAGNMNGYFRRPVGLVNIGYDLFVLDQLNCSITMFSPTEFGQAIFDAVDAFNDGLYEKAGDDWQHVMDLDGNYALAYIGIGRALMRQEKYEEALDYFKLKYDRKNYSKAFKQYRKQWVEEHIGAIVAVIVLLFAIPLTIGKIKSIKHEIDTADIFQ